MAAAADNHVAQPYLPYGETVPKPTSGAYAVETKRVQVKHMNRRASENQLRPAQLPSYPLNPGCQDEPTVGLIVAEQTH